MNAFPRRLLIAVLTLPLLAVACGTAGGLSAEQTAAMARAEDNASSLQLTTNLATTQMLDGRTGEITSLSDIITGDRAVLMWYWAPT